MVRELLRGSQSVGDATGTAFGSASWLINNITPLDHGGVDGYHKVGQTQQELGLFSSRVLAPLGQMNSSRFRRQKIGHSYCGESYDLPPASWFERKCGR